MTIEEIAKRIKILNPVIVSEDENGIWAGWFIDHELISTFEYNITIDLISYTVPGFNGNYTLNNIKVVLKKLEDFHTKGICS